MKRKVTALVIAAAMMVGTSTTALAATANPAGGTSDVYVGVTKTAPENISVTVPTSLAIAVVDDGTTLSTLMGNYMVDANGDITIGGDAGQGINEQRVSFINSGKVDAKVVSAKITNSYGSAWTLKDTPTAAKEMSMKFNNVATGDIAPDHNNTIDFGTGFALASNTITHMPAEVRAGGAAGDYTADEASAKTFVVEWNIEAN